MFSFCKGVLTRLEISYWLISESPAIFVQEKICNIVLGDTSGKHEWKKLRILFYRGADSWTLTTLKVPNCSSTLDKSLKSPHLSAICTTVAVQLVVKDPSSVIAYSSIVKNMDLFCI